MRMCRIESLENRELLSAETITTETLTIEITRLNSITGMFVAYNNSDFDDNTPTIDIKDGLAIATDKVNLTIGETASFDNYTSYDKGINEIIIDVYEIPDASVIDATDFVFSIGNTDDFNSWNIAPDPVEIIVMEDAGVGGVDRVFLRWDDNVIQNQWLHIRVLPTDFDLQECFDFNLQTQDSFFFGNFIGENTQDFIINYDDVFNNIWPSLLTSNVDIDNVSDINRDGVIDNTDMFESVWPNLFHRPYLSKITPIDHQDQLQSDIMNDMIALDQAISKIRAQQKQEEKIRFQKFSNSSYDSYIYLI